MRLLAILGDYYHCSDQQLQILMTVQEHLGFEAGVLRYPRRVESLDFNSIDLLLLWRIGRHDPKESDEQWLTREMEKGIDQFVRAGGGLLCVHGGVASHPTDGPFRQLLGGHFAGHPPEHVEVTVEPSAVHPITESVTLFSAQDEHYRVEVDGDVEHLFTISSKFGRDTGGWVKQVDKGRVMVFLPGHTTVMLEQPSYAQILRSAIRWSASEV